MNFLKFSAIDIGSNAVRLLFSNVVEDGNTSETVFFKSSLVRVPIRLGEDVFVYGEIKQDKIEKLVHAMHAFNHLMQIQKVISYRACATSAMREASNGNEVTEYIFKQTGIKIDIISGEEEAELLSMMREVELVENGNNHLFVDVGGGSTEISLFSNRKKVISHSFDIGTIRILGKQVKKEDYKVLKSWLKGVAENYDNIRLVGSGGNINKIFKLSEKKDGTALSFKKLKHMYEHISSFSVEERIKVLELNPDRADVIIPAAELFLNIMHWTGIEEIYVPVMGLSDGIIRKEYEKYRSGLNKP
jgi:exopolyphosphatase / guanosine-5'-triphosphate,3'-diphosphate pyrophosphatase